MDLSIHSPLPRRKDFRIGIIGSGFIVNDCHLVAYRKAGFNPIAIASRTSARAAEAGARHRIPKVYQSPEQVLDDPSIEILDIAVPPPAQLHLIKLACERRMVKGILAQKPLGMNYAEALEAVNACEEAGITLAVNQNMRYDQSVRAGKTLLEDGTMGEPILATIEMRGIPHWMDWHKELGWLTLRIMSIHHLTPSATGSASRTRFFAVFGRTHERNFPTPMGSALISSNMAMGSAAWDWMIPGPVRPKKDARVIFTFDGESKGWTGWRLATLAGARIRTRRLQKFGTRLKAKRTSNVRCGRRAGFRTLSSGRWRN